MNPVYLQLQQALLAKGFPPGLLDGIWGPATRKAMQAYEIKAGLKITDLPDATTFNSLLGKSTDAPIAWLDEASRLMGTKEVSGKASNPAILDWAQDLDIHYPGDDIAWCGLFVAHTLRAALPDEPLPSNPLGARSYERFGIGVLPQLGAVATFWRTSKSSGLGHVGYLVGERIDAYRIRGGNQSNTVCDAWVSKLRFVGARWPATGGKPFNRTLPQGGAGALSSNEA